MKTQAPKCYSYCRFSSKIQAKGHSLQRQIERSKKWATDRGLVLDESTITDLGISGYSKTSNNVSNGALGKFLEQVKESKIPPKSILIVESLDRLSRAEVLTAFDLFREILKHKIKIVTLTDNQEYDEESLNQNIGQLMISLSIMQRAFEESDTKSQRLKAVWDKKREQINKKPLTAICPMWLRLNPETNKFEEIPERVAIIKRIFEMSVDGYGYQNIIKTLNQEKIPSFRGKSWGQTYIRKVLHGKEVLGEFIPHLKKDGKRMPLKPIQNYYPQIISYGLYQKVHSRFNSMEYNKGGGKNGAIRNLFGLIGRCGYCNGSMRFVNKGKLPKAGQYLVCNRSCLKNEPDCFKLPWRYDEIEEAFLKFSTEISVSDILDNNTKTENENKIGELQTKIDNLNEIKIQKGIKHENGYKNLTDLIQNEPDLSGNESVENLFKDLDKIKEEIIEIDKKIQTLISKSNEIKNSNVIIDAQLNSMQELIKLISYKDDEIDSEKIDLRFKLRNEIRNLIGKIYFLPGGNIVKEKLANFFKERELNLYLEENVNATDEEIDHMKKIINYLIHEFQQSNVKERYFLIFFKSGVIKGLQYDDEKGKIELKAEFDMGGKIRVKNESKPLEIRKFDQIEVINDIIEMSFLDSFRF